MKKIGFLLLAVFLTGVTVTQAQKKQYAIYAVAFYNLENLFDTINQPNTNDEEFTPSGSYRWGGLKYRNKLNNLAYAISNFATDNSVQIKKRTCRYRRIGNRKRTSIGRFDSYRRIIQTKLWNRTLRLSRF